MLFSVTSLAATSIVVAATRETLLSRLLAWAPLVGLGKISYGLYLYHLIVFFGLGSQPGWLRWMVAIGVATVSWWLWERPFLRLKHRFDRTPMGSAPQAE